MVGGGHAKAAIGRRDCLHGADSPTSFDNQRARLSIAHGLQNENYSRYHKVSTAMKSSLSPPVRNDHG